MQVVLHGHIYLLLQAIYIRMANYNLQNSETLNPGGIENSDYKLSSIQAHVFLLWHTKQTLNCQTTCYLNKFANPNK